MVPFLTLITHDGERYQLQAVVPQANQEQMLDVARFLENIEDKLNNNTKPSEVGLVFDY